MAKFKGVRAKGSTIQIRWSYKGKPYQETIFERPTEAAQRRAAKYRDRCIELTRRGDYKADSAQTFLEVAQLWLKHKAKTAKQSTLNTDRKRVQRYWFGLFDEPIASINLARLRQVDYEMDWPSEKTRANAVSNLHQIFKLAFEMDLIDIDPSLKIKAGKHQNPEPDAYTIEEKELILAALPQKYRLFYLIMFEAGLRTGEVLALKHSDIDSDKATIKRSLYLGKENATKTYKARTVRLTKRIQAELADYTQTRFAKSYIFTTQRGKPHRTERRMTAAFHKACDDSGVRRLKPYACRHSFASHSIEAEVSPSRVAKQMGDRLETILRRYVKLLESSKDKSEFDKFEAAVSVL